ncbi:MAG TPA: sialidase family protein, partial [Thermoanaerobaculia bacterium]|nr:sialidase family protein [Thermoanaerobaculia bacterium]
MKRTIAISLLVAAAALPASIGAAKRTRPATFSVEDRRPRLSNSEYASEFLPRINTNFVHGATLAEMPDGDLIAAWYGGTDEVYSDVCIYTSRRDHNNGRWSPPQVLESQPAAERVLRVHVKSLGNPVLFADARGVTLFYVAVLFGGWSGGTICMKTSSDGIAWSDAKRLYTSPFVNIGMLVRSKPFRYSDGSIALPVYHELIRKWAALVRVDDEGRVVDEARLSDGRPLFQPWIVPTGAKSVIALLRWASRMPGSVTVTRSENAGHDWSDVFGTNLVQRDSAVAGVRLSDGSILAAFNHSAWDRRDLSFARTADDGLHWSKPHRVEHDTTPDNV